MITGDDLELFETSLRRATESSTGAALDAALREIGWDDALAVDRRAAVSLLFELQGTSGATSGALDRLLVDALGLHEGASVLLPTVGTTSPPGQVTASGVDVAGVATPRIDGADAVVAVVSTASGTIASVVIPRRELTLRPASGMDPGSGLVQVDAAGLALDLEPLASTSTWSDAVAVAQMALAHELVGASRAMLALARDHAVERIQFGRPIAQFQAVRHRLADTYVAVEAAEAALDGAWDDGSTLAAAAAKAVAGRNARLVARHCQQVLAGIGFTAEHAFHHHLRRVLVLERLFGDARSLTAAIGEELLRTRRLPPLLPL